MGVPGMPPLSPQEKEVLEQEYRHAESRIVRMRSHMVLLAYELPTQREIARAVRCARQTVGRALALYREGRRAALRRRPWARPHPRRVTRAWEQALEEALERGPQACGVARPTWTAELLARYLAQQTGVRVSERTVRRALAARDQVCRRPTYTVRPKAEEDPTYHPKVVGSRC
jgi:transposase